MTLQRVLLYWNWPNSRSSLCIWWELELSEHPFSIFVLLFTTFLVSSYWVFDASLFFFLLISLFMQCFCDVEHYSSCQGFRGGFHSHYEGLGFRWRKAEHFLVQSCIFAHNDVLPFYLSSEANKVCEGNLYFKSFLIYYRNVQFLYMYNFCMYEGNFIFKSFYDLL